MWEALEREIEARVEEMGFEVVELERAGSRARPIWRLRIDRPDSRPGSGVTVEECGRVSRALEPVLDENPEVPPRYLLEVSSPGIERPLVRRRDFERFRGRQIAIVGESPLHDGARRVEGELLGMEGEPGEERILLRTNRGSELSIAWRRVKKVHLVYRWGDSGPADRSPPADHGGEEARDE